MRLKAWQWLAVGLGALLLLRGKGVAGAGAAIARRDAPGTFGTRARPDGSCPEGFVPAVDLAGRRIPGECLPASARTFG